MNVFEVDGLTLGAVGDPYIVSSVDGWDSLATFDPGSTDGAGDGVHAGPARARDRQVRVDIGIRKSAPDVAAAEEALRVALSPRTDRSMPKLVRGRTRGPTKRGWYLPSSNPLSIPGNEANYVHDHVDLVATLWLPNPVLYSDAVVETVYAAAGVETLVNAGSASVLRSGAMSWTITAGGGGCVAPFLAHADQPGERWVLAEVLAPGAVVTVDWSRITRRGSSVRSATVQGPDGSPVATWPALRPGANDVQVGCQTGTVSAVVEHRSTWL